MKRATLAFLGVALGLAAIAVLLLMRTPTPPASPPLSLPDGSSLRLLGITFGTNHVLGTPIGRVAARLPRPVQGLLNRLLGARAPVVHSTTTPEPRLLVWVERKAPTTAAATGWVEGLLADGTGFTSGEVGRPPTLSGVDQFQFRVFPRREVVFPLELFYHDASGGVKRCGRLLVANPARGHFGQWAATPLPATQQAGDVEMTLEKLSTGHDNSINYVARPGGNPNMEAGTNRVDGHNQTFCLLRLRSLSGTNEIWQVAGEEVSDATGNRVSNTSMGWGGQEQSYLTFEPSLWPCEAAWKLRCELKRVKGFAPGETFTFQGVPLGGVGGTSLLNWATNFSGLTVTLTQVKRRPPWTNDAWSSMNLSEATFKVLGLTNGIQLDLVSARTDNGTNLDVGTWSSGGTERSYRLRNLPLTAKTADFTFAVQRTRWVEFVVKPEVAAGGSAKEEGRTTR